MKTDDVIAKLSAQVEPVRRLDPPWRRWLVWVAVSVAGSGAYLTIVGRRMDLAAVFERPVFVAELAILLAMTLAAGLAVLSLSVPGNETRRGTRWIARGAAIGWVLLLGARCLEEGFHFDHGMACASAVSVGSIWPILVLFWMARRAAPLYPLTIGALAGLAGAGWGALVLLVHCPNSDPMHTLLWHALPVAVLAGGGAIIGSFLLRLRAGP